jgi:hypothetical protein
MSVRGLVRKVARLEVLAGRIRQEAPALERLRADPVGTLAAAGLNPDPWQIDVLTCHADRVLPLASRQSGKSTVSAALALLLALLNPASLVLLLSPSTRQSGELLRKVLALFHQLGRPMAVTAESALRLELANGSRVVALPGKEGTVRCFSGVSLLVIDAAARVLGISRQTLRSKTREFGLSLTGDAAVDEDDD